MTEHPRIALDPGVMGGKPVIRGTRVTVELTVGLLTQGWSEQEVLGAYPHLVRDDILACLAYAGHGADTVARSSGRISDVFGLLSNENTSSLSIEEMNELAARGWAGKR